jgi:hypothetical protein
VDVHLKFALTVGWKFRSLSVVKVPLLWVRNVWLLCVRNLRRLPVLESSSRGCCPFLGRQDHRFQKHQREWQNREYHWRGWEMNQLMVFIPEMWVWVWVRVGERQNWKDHRETERLMWSDGKMTGSSDDRYGESDEIFLVRSGKIQKDQNGQWYDQSS